MFIGFKSFWFLNLYQTSFSNLTKLSVLSIIIQSCSTTSALVKGSATAVPLYLCGSGSVCRILFSCFSFSYVKELQMQNMIIGCVFIVSFHFKCLMQQTNSTEQQCKLYIVDYKCVLTSSRLNVLLNLKSANTEYCV